jgi:flagellar motor switch protein FliM
LSTSSNLPAAATDKETPDAESALKGRTRSVHGCDFRLAGRLANEDARALTAIHETLATNLAAALDASFGSAFEVRFDALNQLSVKDHVAEIPALCYIVPFSPQIFMVEFDLDLVFPMIELLLGGAGSEKSADRELSEIEEGIMQDVVSLIMRQAEAIWSIPGLTMRFGPPIKPTSVLELLRPTEKVTVLRFEAKFANASGSFRLVLSTPFADLLVKRLKADRGQKKSRMFSFPVPPLRERMLDCDVEVTAELTELRVPVKDLVSLEPGSVLKLRASIRTPAVLTIGEQALYEAVPVRSGPQRAAQLGRRHHANVWKRR